MAGKEGDRHRNRKVFDLMNDSGQFQLKRTLKGKKINLAETRKGDFVFLLSIIDQILTNIIFLKHAK